jgi:hypothetical protein
MTAPSEHQSLGKVRVELDLDFSTYLDICGKRWYCVKSELSGGRYISDSITVESMVEKLKNRTCAPDDASVSFSNPFDLAVLI